MSIAPPILPTEIDKASYREGRNDAIEECARVAESFKGIVVITPGDIADAIRALKLLNFVVRLPPPSGR